jgi:hypothetical protein
MRVADIDEILVFLENYITDGRGTCLDSVLIADTEVLRKLILFLRHHGKYVQSHLLLSLLQHNLQKNIFHSWGEGRANEGINDLISFSTCLEEQEDMKYLANVFNFYTRHIFPMRHSNASRVADIERIMRSVLLPSPGRRQSNRALAGYKFYYRLQHKYTDLGVSSSKMFVQVGVVMHCLICCVDM